MRRREVGVAEDGSRHAERRIAFRQVTDFINLFPFNFIFNCADIFVVIGAILICIYGVFFDKSASEKKTAADEAAENSAE
ncbi:MAG: signal peptidase II [Oscillospiraceae bacterium]|nr:signal peptidase II [Oscillospiraceae bacterium]